MRDMIYQEFYKFKKLRSVYFGILFVIIMIIYTALTSENSANMFIVGFGMAQWIGMILITISSYFILMECDYNTIIQIIYKNNSKFKIYFSKLWIIIIYSIILHLIGFTLTMLIKFLYFNNSYNISDQIYNKSLFESLIINTFGSFAMNLLLCSIIFLLANITYSNVVVVGTGLCFSFFGNSVMSAVMSALKFTKPILKWNPFNMFSIMKQLPNGRYNHAIELNNLSLVIGTFAYIIVFLYMGFICFKKRRF